MREVAFAFMQVMRAGSEEQQEQARKVLVTARRDLYRILADGRRARERLISASVGAVSSDTAPPQSP